MDWNKVKRQSKTDEQYFENTSAWLKRFEEFYAKTEKKFGKGNPVYMCALTRAKSEIKCHEDSKKGDLR